jgi:copper homeostasis protein
MTNDPFMAMEDLISLGIDRILTSGQQKTALEGASLIRSLIRIAGGRIIIMPGSGVKEHNVNELISITGAGEVHIHLEKQVHSEMIFRHVGISMGKPDQSEYEHTITDWERIYKVRNTKYEVRT